MQKTPNLVPVYRCPEVFSGKREERVKSWKRLVRRVGGVIISRHKSSEWRGNKCILDWHVLFKQTNYDTQSRMHNIM